MIHYHRIKLYYYVWICLCCWFLNLSNVMSSVELIFVVLT
jgi:hypothetical protein